jgi:hypothetical protein
MTAALACGAESSLQRCVQFELGTGRCISFRVQGFGVWGSELHLQVQVQVQWKCNCICKCNANGLPDLKKGVPHACTCLSFQLGSTAVALSSGWGEAESSSRCGISVLCIANACRCMVFVGLHRRSSQFRILLAKCRTHEISLNSNALMLETRKG